MFRLRVTGPDFDESMVVGTQHRPIGVFSVRATPEGVVILVLDRSLPVTGATPMGHYTWLVASRAQVGPFALTVEATTEVAPTYVEMVDARAVPREPPRREAGRALVLSRDGREVFAMTHGVAVVGRAPYADVRVEGLRQHAQIRREGDDFVLEDYGGTFVDGERVVVRIVLAEGNTIRIGEDELDVTYSSASLSPSK